MRQTSLSDNSEKFGITKFNNRANRDLSAYKRQRSFLAAGILLDDVLNSVMLYRVEAVKKDGDMHSGVAGFQKEQDIRNGCLFHK